MEIAPSDVGKFSGGAKKIARPQPGTWNIAPAVERELVNTTRARKAVQRHIPSQEFHVENPAGGKRLLEDLLDFRSDPEQFRATLRILDRQVENQRSTSRKNAAQVMPRRAALNVPAQKPDTRPQNDIHLGLRKQHTQQIVDRIQRSREISVPESDIRAPL